MLGWVVVWYHAPHHIGGGIVCCTLAHCVPGRSLLAVSSGALTLGMCACALAHGIVSSRALTRCILCTRTRTCSHLYVALCVCATVTTQRWLRTNCHMQTIYRGTMKSSCACVCYDIIRTKIKQNSDVFLDLFWST
jgi:hypothetical protein